MTADQTTTDAPAVPLTLRLWEIWTADTLRVRCDICGEASRYGRMEGIWETQLDGVVRIDACDICHAALKARAATGDEPQEVAS